jgi:UDP-N-acetylmuramoyl-tripeptide--D-alanyl-D-alanine ligase
MDTWTIPQLLEATQGQLVRGAPAATAQAIAIDSRQVRPGEAFIAIQGHRFDGHHFLEEAVRRGASCLIVSSATAAAPGGAGVPVILVDDTTEALGDLARYHRRRLGAAVVAITGSCGKTTTKDLTAHLLAERGLVLKTTGSQNNHIGVPLTLLRLTPEHRSAVVELGSNHPGEIAYLTSIAEPDLALVTNVGPAHLEFFGSLMAVMAEKLSVIGGLPPQGTAVLPGDQLDVCLEAQRHRGPEVRLVTFGTTDRCDIQGLDVQRAAEGMTFRLRDHASQWRSPLVGYHNVENAFAAIAAAWALGIPLAAVRERLQTFETVPLRSQVVRCQGLTILNDCYNANPLSFARALEMLRDLDVRRKVAIVGDMLELGEYAPSAHQAIGRLASQLGIDAVFAVGEYAECVAQGVREAHPAMVTTCRTVQELLGRLPQMLQQGDGLLVKGSRKLNLEQVTDFLVARYRDGGRDVAR